MRILSLYIPLMLAAVTIAGCNSSATTPIPDEVARPVKTITVAQTSPSTTRSFPGVVEAAVQTSMAFRVGGPVTSFKVVIGERVAKGQELARIDSRDYEVRVTALQARLAEAQATLRAMRQGARAEDVATLKAERSAAASRLDEAEKNLQRYARLLAEGAIAKATVDSARTGLEAAKATLEGVDKNIEKATSGARVEDIEAMEARIKSITADLPEQRTAL